MQVRACVYACIMHARIPVAFFCQRQSISTHVRTHKLHFFFWYTLEYFLFVITTHTHAQILHNTDVPSRTELFQNS